MKFLHVLFLRRLCQSFWFIPAALIIGAFVASFIFTWIDHKLNLGTYEWGKILLSDSPDGARAILSTIAGSTITVAGVILSTTIVVLTLASQQYSPRLLRNFIEDRPSQIVIGSFVACFIYSILILRNIRSGDLNFVPHLSVLIAVLAAVCCICLMIYFIHHVSVEIQVQSVIARVHRDLREKIDELFPSSIGRNPAPTEGDETALESADSHALAAKEPGYLQAVQNDILMELSQREKIVIQIHPRPGKFIFENDTVVEIFDGDNSEACAESIEGQIFDALVIGRFPTSEQDVLFPIQQLKEIAIRALSPGINDPHTAIECIDYLASALCTLAGRVFPSKRRYDDNGELRVIAQSYSYETLLSSAFREIHFHGQANPMIVAHLFKVLAKIIDATNGHSGRRNDVMTLAKEFLDISENAIDSETIRAHVREAYRQSFAPVLKEISPIS